MGRDFDDGSGLYYYRRRFLSSTLGVFVNRDPVGYRSGPSVYQFVGSGPPARLDPEGLESGSIAISSTDTPSPMPPLFGFGTQPAFGFGMQSLASNCATFVAKSFINSIYGTGGSGALPNPTPGWFATQGIFQVSTLVTALTFYEDPANASKGSGYRLYSAVTICANCQGGQLKGFHVSSDMDGRRNPVVIAARST